MAKHVPSAVPGHGPSDMSGALAAHRDREQGVTAVPQTSGPDDIATAGPEAIVMYPDDAGY